MTNASKARERRAEARRIVEQQKARERRRRVTLWSTIGVIVILLAAGIVGILLTLALVALQLVYTYAPFMQSLFGSEPLSLTGWLLPLAFSVTIFVAVELLKAWRRRPTFNANA